MTNGIRHKQKQNVELYFKKVDAGEFDAVYYQLFTEDVELYFPKFGFAYGKAGIRKFCEAMAAYVKSLTHDIENFNYVVSGNMVVVEGREAGVNADNKPFPDNVTAFGKFCNVFEFDGDLIKRVHIYVDPDFTSEDAVRIKRLGNHTLSNEDHEQQTENHEIGLSVEFSLKPGVINEFEAVLLPHLERVASEDTCITMIANRDPKDETRYMLYERWAFSIHFTPFRTRTDGDGN
ncbi:MULTISPECIES: nuclear transport factor 2 family protein [Chryseobacterium]|uniref:Ketosteroid isomerase-like protein n=1 Tax=Chryseobacterium camelliae TaxID=1265445 RepID=A0ABU0TER6_9FLAO|nr:MULTISPECIES: nuclear transport factor 2 family protein [Chryseobacterium]MDT3406641.1 ketosteroid isomerase-like protein [Pseudacidovorax intermedius]MDQ1095563.1 ketosteroid isomerase-like protein [Chryseobacterium camelliae]MDQ1099499.1 ketosteroid isomerase-like protein [Chryseobacterium sp. SORGH_AS_1048]MDR6086846.1 ketosteroid isomerase-like protein [Chryseobacterium sp. SORGH_AS_0909]MDR6131217.1 ketosteroid isomerase-like protein [Chryseobacterium sp. SORGH_AS_1175]